jgi:choline dehydrogenase-like flavoprotein
MTGGYFVASDFRPVPKYDVCIVGSGAGGAVMAYTLANAGFSVIVLEEGGHYTKKDFKMREDLAYPQLYQEAAGRVTKDLGISILQGRAVGGTTVVNWTTSYRTPEHVLEHWAKVHGVGGFTKKDLDPHWDAIEERLNIKEIALDESNRNNRLLYDGCQKLGFEAAVTSRNTRECFKSGYCGMGCPVDAKQSMLVTYLPDAVEKGAVIVSRARVDRLERDGDRIVSLTISDLGEDGYNPTGRMTTINADRFIISAGAIGSPAILIRSGLGGGMTGKRTFLHPVTGITGIYKEEVRPFYGAPQSVASHHFADRGDNIGFFMEAAPLHPLLAALASTTYGKEHRGRMVSLANMSAHVGLTIDGFHPSETGGTVEVRKSGAPVVDYVIPPRVWEGLRAATKELVKINLAAGAEKVCTPHDPALEITKESQLSLIDDAPYETGRMIVFAAHVMGGCMMGDDAKTSVVRSSDLRHHQMTNLHVVDGSVLPTSLGVNPQETIYGLSRLMGSRLVDSWKRA